MTYGGVGDAFNKGDGGQDLTEAKRPISDEVVPVGDRIGIGSVAGDHQTVLAGECTDGGKHGNAAVLQLRLAQPLGVGEHGGGDVVKLGEIHRVEHLVTSLHRYTDPLFTHG